MNSGKDYIYDDEEYTAEDDCDYNDDDEAYEIADEVDDDDVKEEVEIYSVLTAEEIRKRQNDDVCMVCWFFSVPIEIAILLLLQFNWNINAFSDEERIRRAIGLLSGYSVLSGKNRDSIVCNICFENFDFDQMRAAATCGHLFCIICWNSYISNSINDGPSCLTLRCPDPSCSVLIGEDLIKLVSIENQKKYNYYLLRSYVENNKNLKWCPAPDCVNAIELEVEPQIVNFDVKCNCSYTFCWNCLEEVHRPVDCETVAKWNHKNSNESGNTEWILANSKPCPKCKKPIEKNQGCMHMTCTTPCLHEFCWLCLGPWKEHGSGSSFYSCNKYQEAAKDGKFSEEERKKIEAKESINIYTHFYERWAANESSRKQSVLHLEELKSEKLQKISDAQKVIITNIEYIPKAWDQIIECRRVLKWAYAYGYYIPLSDQFWD